MLKQTADTINGVAEKLKPHKLRVGYHNHTTDFNRLDGEYWWNRFADGTSKDVVLQFDTGNASEKDGVDVVEVLKRNPGPGEVDAHQAVLEDVAECLHRRRRAEVGRRS